MTDKASRSLRILAHATYIIGETKKCSRRALMLRVHGFIDLSHAAEANPVRVAAVSGQTELVCMTVTRSFRL